MLYSKLSNEEFLFINLHAEAALDFQDDFSELNEISKPSDRKRGIFSTTVSALVLDELKKEEPSKDLLLDMAYITEIEGNSWTQFIEIIKIFLGTEKCIHIIELQENLKIKFEEHCKSAVECCMKKDGCILHISAQDINYKDEKYYVQTVKTLYISELKKTVNNCIEKRAEGQYHVSGGVYLEKFINIKKMLINGSEAFLFYCIYEMAMKLVENKYISLENQMENVDKVLFFHTMNGAFVGGVLSALLQMDMVYLDHLGPINSVCKKHFERNMESAKKYIIVADVICTTSEISRAETLIEFNGGTVACRLCWIDIETIKKNTKKQLSCITISANNNFVNYLVKTDLCNNCKVKACRNERGRKRNV